MLVEDRKDKIQTAPILSAGVEKHPYEYLSVSDDGPEIVFINGYRMHFRSWDRVYPRLNGRYSTLLFNRLGTGKSCKAKSPQDAHAIVEDIHRLTCLTLNKKSPYILVAHSLGGLYANLYARRYRSEVAGVVFVDCPHPNEIAEQKEFVPPYVVSKLNQVINYCERFFDPYVHSEDQNVKRSVYQIHEAGDFPNIPIAVVSGVKAMPFVPEKALDIHRTYQQKLLNLSSRSQHYCCEKSSHFPQITQPDIVIRAIDELVTSAAINKQQ